MFTRLTVILLATFTVALHSKASWDDNFWPASEKNVREKIGSNWIFQADVVTSNLSQAVRERVEAATLYPHAIAYSAPRRPDVALELMKQSLKGVIEYYLDQTQLPTPYDPKSAIITNLQYWSVTSILSHCSLPTNFFDYTPPRNLAGHLGTGSAHWTNSSSYGWDATRKVITNLIYTYQSTGVLKSREQIKASAGTSPFQDQVPEIYDNCYSLENINEYTLAEMTYSNFIPAAIWYDSFWANIYTLDGSQESFFYSEYTNNITAGYPAFYVGPSTNMALADRYNIAFTFQKIDGQIYYGSFCGLPKPPSYIVNTYQYTNCLFSSACDWKYTDQIGPANTSQIGDGNIFVLDDYVALVDNYGCSVMDFIGNYGTFDAITDPSYIDCVGGVTSLSWYPGYAAGRSLAIPLQYNRNYSHIIEWDFTYK